MGKDKKQTQISTNESSGSSTTAMDRASQDFIKQMRKFGLGAADEIMGMEGLFGGPTDTFMQGIGATQGALGGLQGLMQMLQGGMQQGRDFGGDLRRFQPNVGETGFDPQSVGDGGAQDAYREAIARAQQQGGGDINFSPSAFNPNQAQGFFSPFQDEVVGGVQANADRQREQALSRSAGEATARGAFGGSRSGILQAESLRNVNQDEAAQVAQLKNQGFQTAMGQAMGAHQSHQGNSLQAAIAGQQGRLQSRAQLGSLGMQAAGLGQQGRIAENEIGLRTALGNMQGRTTDAQMGLQRALGLQQGQMEAGRLDLQDRLQSMGMGLQGIGMQGQLGQQLAGLGETERQIGNQQAQEQLFKLQQALGFHQGSFGQALGQTNNFKQQSRGKQTQIEHGNLGADLMGAALTFGPMLFGMPPMPGAAQGIPGIADNQVPRMDMFNRGQQGPIYAPALR